MKELWKMWVPCGAGVKGPAEIPLVSQEIWLLGADHGSIHFFFTLDPSEDDKSFFIAGG